jgi:hypothetical protein
VSQLLGHLRQALADVCPPDLNDVAARTRAAWEQPVAEEASATAEILLLTLEPYQREIEHHFALQGQRRFHGIMAGYLYLLTRIKYVGSTLKERVSLWPRAGSAQAAPPASWDLATFTRACSDTAASRHLNARSKALANRLLVEAGHQDFPVALLTPPVEATAATDWRQRHAQTLIEILQEVETEWSRPSGARRWLHALIVWTGDWLPPVALLAACVRLLWLYFMTDTKLQLFDFLLPLVVLLTVLVIIHILITLLLPLRWGKIRGEFQRRLRQRLQGELEEAYEPIPGRVAEALLDERRRAQQVLNETREVAAWLEQREQAASVAGLYGK